MAVYDKTVVKEHTKTISDFMTLKKKFLFARNFLVNIWPKNTKSYSPLYGQTKSFYKC